MNPMSTAANRVSHPPRNRACRHADDIKTVYPHSVLLCRVNSRLAVSLRCCTSRCIDAIQRQASWPPLRAFRKSSTFITKAISSATKTGGTDAHLLSSPDAHMTNRELSCGM